MAEPDVREHPRYLPPDQPEASPEELARRIENLGAELAEIERVGAIFDADGWPDFAQFLEAQREDALEKFAERRRPIEEVAELRERANIFRYLVTLPGQWRKRRNEIQTELERLEEKEEQDA